MTTTAAIRDRGHDPGESPARGGGVGRDPDLWAELEDRAGAAQIVADARAYRRAADQGEIGVLVAAVRFAAANQVFDPDLAMRAPDPAGGGFEGGGEAVVASEGAPLVSDIHIAELAAALALSTPAGVRLVGEAVELRYRLPRIFARVLAGEVSVWRARRIAARTMHLCAEAAAFVDTHLARFAHRAGTTSIDRAVHAATEVFMPDLAARHAAERAERRHLSIETRVDLDGTVHLEGELDLPDARALNTALAHAAAALTAAGSSDPLTVRRAHAAGIIARDYLHHHHHDHDHDQEQGHNGNHEPGPGKDHDQDQGHGHDEDHGQGHNRNHERGPGQGPDQGHDHDQDHGHDEDHGQDQEAGTGTPSSPDPQAQTKTCSATNPGEPGTVDQTAPAAEPDHPDHPAPQPRPTTPTSPAPAAEPDPAGSAEPAPDSSSPPSTPRGSPPAKTHQPRRPRQQIVIYAHLSADTFTTPDHPGHDPDHATRTTSAGLATIDGTTDPVLADAVRNWCTTPGTTVIVKPVIDLTTAHRIDTYTVPARIAERVALRDRTCIFPWCTHPATRCDTDHTTPYSDGGPTSTDNLAPLCRRHHRLKTHHHWSYQHHEPGIYHWTSPLGHTYTRDTTGTHDTSP